VKINLSEHSVLAVRINLDFLPHPGTEETKPHVASWLRKVADHIDGGGDMEVRVSFAGLPIVTSDMEGRAKEEQA